MRALYGLFSLQFSVLIFSFLTTDHLVQLHYFLPNSSLRKIQNLQRYCRKKMKKITSWFLSTNTNLQVSLYLLFSLPLVKGILKTKVSFHQIFLLLSVLPTFQKHWLWNDLKYFSNILKGSKNGKKKCFFSLVFTPCSLPWTSHTTSTFYAFM